MNAILRWLITLFLFWVSFFLLQQTVFLLLNAGRLAPIPWTEILSAYRHAFAMHLATAGYVMLLPTALVGVCMWRDSAAVRRAIAVILVTVVVVSAVVNVADCGLFQAWGTKVNRKALSYLVYPRAVGAAVAGAPVVLLLLVLAGECVVGIRMLRRWRMPVPLPPTKPVLRLPFTIVGVGVFFVAARGGVQDDPIDKSWSFYSAHPVLNLSAVNGLWNLLAIAAEPAEFERNPYAFMPTGEAQAIVEGLTRPGRGPSERIFTVERPNIVIILLESWSGDIIGPLGGEPDVTPHFNALCDSGLLFTRFHSTGFRTEQGVCAILSGFPSQPKTTIVRKYGKFDRLPSLVNTLDSNGYRSRWYYTGDVVFANTRSYLESMGFDVVHSEEDLPGTRRTRWGAYDEELFAYYFADTATFRAPYFHVIMTATSHEPFDAPVEGGFVGDTDPQRYRNTVAYTDRCLGRFFADARRSGDWDRTIYVVVADHGHYLPKYRNHFDLERHRIACLLLGGALRPDLRGTTDHTYASHVDLAATLLGQLGLPHDRFGWSKDLFDPATHKFAFYTFDEGFGYADTSQAVIFDAVRERPVHWRDSSAGAAADSAAVRNGKALLQVELDRYMQLDQ